MECGHSTDFLIGLYQGQHFVAAELIGATLVVLALLTNGLALKFFHVR
ncbi:hypothetical protein [Aromatoleum toluclasticum]|nr:hypothetical protein [Aromatoleum toluclasticum]